MVVTAACVDHHVDDAVLLGYNQTTGWVLEISLILEEHEWVSSVLERRSNWPIRIYPW